LLAASGIEFEVAPSTFDEGRLRHLPPLAQARRAAHAKAQEVAARHPGRWVLGCDTVVALDGAALGKPSDGVEASRMLKRLSGREHQVISAVWLVGPGPVEVSGYGRSVVAISRLSHDDISAYVATGEPLDKAGAYAIQGQGGDFTALVRGRVDTVIGLPMHVVRRLAQRVGYPLPGGRG
jgi:septum formation protein